MFVAICTSLTYCAVTDSKAIKQSFVTRAKFQSKMPRKKYSHNATNTAEYSIASRV